MIIAEPGPKVGSVSRGDRARTCYLRFWRPPLYLVSYTPMSSCRWNEKAARSLFGWAASRFALR